MVGGSKGMAGAVILACRAALKTGTGQVTSYTPSLVSSIVQAAIPEATNISDLGDDYLESFYAEVSNYDVLVIGNGMGWNEKTKSSLIEILKKTHTPAVLDADAINIISQNHSLMELVPRNSILTPHHKEFDRLTGLSGNSLSRLEKQVNFSKRYGVYIVLKGAYSSISTPSGKVIFNPTGNPAMATAGSGDVLSGIIAGFLAQGLTPKKAAIYGTYIHGLAGDIASDFFPGILAGEIANTVPSARKIVEK